MVQPHTPHSWYHEMVYIPSYPPGAGYRGYAPHSRSLVWYLLLEEVLHQVTRGAIREVLMYPHSIICT